MKLVIFGILAAVFTGALGWTLGCTINLGETTPVPPECLPSLATFMAQGGIWDTAIDPPDQTKSCVAMTGCHAQATGRSALRLIYKPRDQFTADDWQANFDEVAQFLNCGTPEASEFITKPEAGVDPHLGGDLWVCDATCEPIRTVEAWISAAP